MTGPDTTSPPQCGRHQVERLVLLTSVWTNPRRFAMDQDNVTDALPPDDQSLGAPSAASVAVRLRCSSLQGCSSAAASAGS